MFIDVALSSSLSASTAKATEICFDVGKEQIKLALMLGMAEKSKALMCDN